MVALQIFYLLVLGIVLAVSANWVLKATVYFSKQLRIKSFIFGFMILGVATTIPEMFVAFQSVRDGVPQLSVGNLLGGSIFLLSFLLGGSAVFLGRIILDHGLTKRDIGSSALVIALPVFVLWDGELTRAEGILLLGAYILHVFFINHDQHMLASVEKHARRMKKPLHAIFLGIVGLAGLAVSSRFIVSIAEDVAKHYGISAFVIGLFLVTLGTNLPELTLAVSAVIRKKRGIAFGDVLGSAVINTPMLGIICIAAPFTIIDYTQMRITLVLLLATAAFFFWAAWSRRDITRKEGIVLLSVYILFVVVEMMRL